MKDLETILKEKFINLLNTRNLDEIDVNLLCEEVKIKRQTFYYHYKNIFDLIYDIVKDKPFILSETNSIEVILKGLFNQYFESYEFFSDILESSANEIITEMIFSYLYKSFSEYLAKYKLGIDSKKDLARFFANSLTYQSTYYLNQKEYSSNEIVLKLLLFINAESVDNIVKIYTKHI